MADTKITDLTGLTTPGDTDVTVIVDTSGTPTTKKLAWSNLKATLKMYFDTLYAPISTIITTPTAWTPTFTGFGTVSSVTAYSWRVGAFLHFEICATISAGTATEARISYGFNGIDANVTSASTYPTLQAIGSGAISVNTGNIIPLAEASKTYMALGSQVGGSQAGIVKRSGSNISDVAQVLSVRGAVRVAGW